MRLACEDLNLLSRPCRICRQHICVCLILRKAHILFRNPQRRQGSLVPIPPPLIMMDRAGLVETVKEDGSSI
jgi:hypothetical protein